MNIPHSQTHPKIIALYVYNITTLFRGGRTRIARHNLDVFGGGGPGKCQQAFIFLTAFYLQAFILVGLLILYGNSFMFFKKSRGAFKMSDCIFEKNNARKWKKCKIIVWRSANSCRIVENPKCRKFVGPQLLGISNTFYTFSAPFLSFLHVT